MFAPLAFSVAVVGSAIAGIVDLKTTEIPDEVSLGMVAVGLMISLVWSVVEWNPVHIFRSAAVGSAFFTFGLLMYLSGQWGGGDAKVLTGLGTLIPTAPAFGTQIFVLPFSVVLVLNTFMIGAAYMLVYALAISLGKGGVWEDFRKRVWEERKRIALISALPAALVLISGAALGPGTHLLYLLFLIPVVAGLLLLLRFLKAMEDVGFKKRVDTEELREGDMLAEEIEEIDTTHDATEELGGIAKFLLAFAVLPLTMFLFEAAEGFYFYMSLPAPILGISLGILYILYSRSFEIFGSVFESSSTRIRGLEKGEVEKIRQSYDTVEIREGVRFAPVFPVAAIVTVYYGNLLFLII